MSGFHSWLVGNGMVRSAEHISQFARVRNRDVPEQDQ